MPLFIQRHQFLVTGDVGETTSDAEHAADVRSDVEVRSA